MLKRCAISKPFPLAVASAFAISVALCSAAHGQDRPQATSPQAAGHVESQAQPPTPEEIHARTQRLIANQHKDDAALDEYERVERYQDFTLGAHPQTIEDKTFRIVPDGGGTVKILLKDKGTPTDPADYRRQLQLWEDILERILQPDNSRGKAAREKYEKRQHDRADFVDAAAQAYLVKWVGQEIRNSRRCDIFELTPNPAFQPHSMFQSALAHVTAKIWVDRDSGQMVRGEANVLSDISFGGGLLGKLYRGSFVSMEQAEVAPGIWLPARTEYQFSGRKFLFPFSEHQIIEASHYRHLGSPREALAIVQNELATGKPFSEDP
ncbi:MAG TPA: hypothetical protein VMB02_10930 [Candidatus Aquilonibacter sp.]|nr:hypothetical protein [Candidatus Aquilonibacter sp.]